MVIAVEASIDRATMIYWVVHGSSLVRATRQQLRHETVPERQARPKAENDLQRPLAERILAALKPVRGPVRGLDLASRAQSPDDFPSLGGGSSIHTSDGALNVPPHEPQHPPSTTTATTAPKTEPAATAAAEPSPLI